MKVLDSLAISKKTSSVIDVQGVWKKFRIYHERNQSLKEIILRGKRADYEELWALKDVSFSIPQGMTLGIVGENGSGKSTLLKILARILKPNKGSFVVNGKVSALLELGAGFHPELTGRENIYLNGSILGLSQREIRDRFDEIVEFSELERFIDTPVKSYSSGMYLRLGFAVAVSVDPNVLLIDEILAVGDEAFQRKCSDKIFDFKNRGKTIVLVSHGLEAVRSICDEAIWLHEGEIQARDEARKVVDLYLNKVNEEEQQRAGRGGEEQHLGTRVGSREVEITKVAFCDSDGKERDCFQTGQGFVVRIYYRAHQSIDKPVFGVAIYKSDGTHVTGPNTRLHRLEIETVSGEGCVEYAVDSLPLLPGTYLFSAAIYDYACLHPYDHHEKMYTFRILPSGEEEFYGVVQIPCAWRHVKEKP